MKKAVMMVMVMMLAGTAMAAEMQVPAGAYIIGPGDVLNISVWKDEALSKMVTVLPDGKITFPLIGEVQAGGKSVAQLKEDLEKKLYRYVPGAEISLLVQQVNSMLIYVIGRVNNPGRFVLNTNVDVLQALSMAGGLNPFAKRGSVKIYRKTPIGTQIFNFDYDDVTGGKNLEQNITLMRGDVIVAP